MQFREGNFYLQDVSTNGVYVNDDMEPLAKRGSSGYLLGNGDVLRMGEYHIVAAVEARKEPEEPLPAVPTSIHSLRPLRRAGDRDIGAPLNLEELLVPVIDMDPVLPVGAYGQAVIPAPCRRSRACRSRPARCAVRVALPGANTEPQLPPSVTAESISQRMARLAEAVAREPRIGTSAVALEDMRTGLEAFCRGAGIAPEVPARRCPGTPAASCGPVVPRGLRGTEGSGAHAQRDAQSLSHRVADP